MPFIKSKSTLLRSNNSSHPNCYNPFPDFYQPNNHPWNDKSAKNPSPNRGKCLKKGGKCLQLVMICQKLLKPFGGSSGNKNKQINRKMEKSKSAHHINYIDGSKSHPNSIEKSRRSKPRSKVDACVQTNFEEYQDSPIINNNNDKNRNNYLYEIPIKAPCYTEEPVKTKNATSANITEFDSTNDDIPRRNHHRSISKSFWDLDIDSAIVGDFNSELSLDEKVDPLYSTIKFTEDGVPYQPSNNYYKSSVHYQELFDASNCVNSNASSPKSGIYSKINKVHSKNFTIDTPKFQFKYPKEFCQTTDSNSYNKLNFDQIMRIRSQLGLNTDRIDNPVDPKQLSYSSIANNSSINTTPILPKRNYGNSVLNLIAKCRQKSKNLIQSHSTLSQNRNISQSTLNDPTYTTPSQIYSPIWQHYLSIDPSKFIPTPASEPTHAKRINTKHNNNVNNNNNNNRSNYNYNTNPYFHDNSSTTDNYNNSNSLSSVTSVTSYKTNKTNNNNSKINYPNNFYDSIFPISTKLKSQEDNVNVLLMSNNDVDKTLKKNAIIDKKNEPTKLRHMDSEIDLHSLYCNKTSKHSVTGTKQQGSTLISDLACIHKCLCDSNKVPYFNHDDSDNDNINDMMDKDDNLDDNQDNHRYRFISNSSSNHDSLLDPNEDEDDEVNATEDVGGQAYYCYLTKGLVLQPLMERSCEDDVVMVRSDTFMIPTLDYINIL